MAPPGGERGSNRLGPFHSHDGNEVGFFDPKAEHAALDIKKAALFAKATVHDFADGLGHRLKHIGMPFAEDTSEFQDESRGRSSAIRSRTAVFLDPSELGLFVGHFRRYRFLLSVARYQQVASIQLSAVRNRCW